MQAIKERIPRQRKSDAGRPSTILLVRPSRRNTTGPNPLGADSDPFEHFDRPRAMGCGPINLSAAVAARKVPIPRIDEGRNSSADSFARNGTQRRIAADASRERAVIIYRDLRKLRMTIEHLEKLFRQAITSKPDDVGRGAQPLVARNRDPTLASRPRKNCRAVNYRVADDVRAKHSHPSRHPPEHSICGKSDGLVVGLLLHRTVAIV